MKELSRKISELQLFADIMATKDDMWLVRFKRWFNCTLSSYCRVYTLFLLAESDFAYKYRDMTVDDFTQALFNNYVAEIFKSARYRREKLEWWNEVYTDYQNALLIYDRLKRQRAFYIASHLRKLKNCSYRIQVKDIKLSMTDIVEIAFARYAAEAKGNYLSFEKFMQEKEG
ncbi:MAG: hypothetical protein E7016_02015 [Alphaproteobacteria bacterium]|nr:hypothetical protein [Alphaproteobacteria bacterium]